MDRKHTADAGENRRIFLAFGISIGGAHADPLAKRLRLRPGIGLPEIGRKTQGFARPELEPGIRKRTREARLRLLGFEIKWPARLKNKGLLETGVGPEKIFGVHENLAVVPSHEREIKEPAVNPLHLRFIRRLRLQLKKRQVLGEMRDLREGFHGSRHHFEEIFVQAEGHDLREAVHQLALEGLPTGIFNAHLPDQDRKVLVRSIKYNDGDLQSQRAVGRSEEHTSELQSR